MCLCKGNCKCMQVHIHKYRCLSPLTVGGIRARVHICVHVYINTPTCMCFSKDGKDWPELSYRHLVLF